MIFKVLAVLGETALNLAEAVDVILTMPYGSSYSQLRREMVKKEDRRGRRGGSPAQKRQARDLLYRLRRDGLIEEVSAKNGAIARLTGKGERLLANLKAKYGRPLPPARYAAEKGNALVVVSYDIPESDRIKRDWLRSVLKNLGLEAVHKSVWFGKGKLPAEFIKDIHRLGMDDFVEIFEVGKVGSLRQIV